MSRLRAAVALLVLVLLQGVGHSTADEAGWGDDSVAPVRPGAKLGVSCTFGFMYVHATNGSLYASTVGHCASAGATVSNGGQPIGTVVWSYPSTSGPKPDFALIQLTDPSKVNPRVMTWDGPCGVDIPRRDEPIAIHGNNPAAEAVNKQARSGTILPPGGAVFPETFYISIPTAEGDSGAPIIHKETRMAIGMVSQVGHGHHPSVQWILDTLAAEGYPLEIARSTAPADCA